MDSVTLDIVTLLGFAVVGVLVVASGFVLGLLVADKFDLL